MKRALPVIIVIILLLIIGGGYAYKYYMEKYSYSSERADLDEYFGVPGGDRAAVVLNTDRTELTALRRNVTDYLSYDVVCELISNRFYYGKEDDILLYVLPDRIVRNEIGSNVYTDSKGGRSEESAPVTLTEGGELYLNLAFVAHFAAFEYKSFEDPDYIWLVTEYDRQTTAAVTKDSHIRYRGGIKSEILADVNKDDRLVLLEEMETWAKVMDDEAHVGYIELKELTDYKDVEQKPTGTVMAKDEDYKGNPFEGRINMGFHAIAGTMGNDTLESVVRGTRSMNVIAPTWFMLADEDGGLDDYASADYVVKAHSLGLEVWGVLDDFNGVAIGVSTEYVMTHEKSRLALIDNLISRAVELGLDGINVDIENVAESFARSYVEFIRELSVSCRQQGLTLSVDNYVPFHFNNYYDLKEQGVMADYVLIMGYDEHYAGSPEAGSVASIGYVDNGIAKTIESVPPEKVICAVPFYTRIWKTEKDGTVTSEAVTMITANEFVSNHALDLVWDEETCQNYGEYTDKEGRLVQVWMEDTQSLKTKLTVMFGHGIAGVAEWELGYETEDVWPLIEGFING